LKPAGPARGKYGFIISLNAFSFQKMTGWLPLSFNIHLSERGKIIRSIKIAVKWHGNTQSTLIQ
jgi:hypothetical protein